jgi:hypothetical protein
MRKLTQIVTLDGVVRSPDGPPRTRAAASPRAAGPTSPPVSSLSVPLTTLVARDAYRGTARRRLLGFGRSDPAGDLHSPL